AAEGALLRRLVALDVPGHGGGDRKDAQSEEEPDLRLAVKGRAQDEGRGQDDDRARRAYEGDDREGGGREGRPLEAAPGGGTGARRMSKTVASARRRRSTWLGGAAASACLVCANAHAQPLRLRADAYAEARAPAGLIVLQGEGRDGPPSRQRPWLDAEGLVWA